MLWTQLFDKIGKQPLHTAQHNHVTVARNGRIERLKLVFSTKNKMPDGIDKCTVPYLMSDISDKNAAVPYTVCLLFNKYLTKVLLQTKDRTDFAGRLNGVGGKVKQDEFPEEGARREIREETGCTDFQDFLWLGDLCLPGDCNADTHERDCLLHFYAGIVASEDNCAQQPGETEALNWYPLDTVLACKTAKPLAGDGDLLYFIQKAVAVLKERRQA